mgnify:CR=1 FL=1|jgi:hypothetical protein|tara:strand:+ start:390 stop:563 length:174 start_codon:yes stop_codon:yes gene_type:complete
MIDNEQELIRTDSTIVAYIPYKNDIGVRLSPLGRKRRILRLDKEFIEEYKKYMFNNV